MAEILGGSAKRQGIQSQWSVLYWVTTLVGTVKLVGVGVPNGLATEFCYEFSQAKAS